MQTLYPSPRILTAARYPSLHSQGYRLPGFLTAADYRSLIAKGYGFTDFGYTTNWQSQVLRQPVGENQNVTITGGGGVTNYTAALNVQNDQGIFLRSNNRDVTARMH